MKKLLRAGGIVTLFTLSGCVTSHDVISRNVETAQGVNVVSTDKGNVIGSISMRRGLTSLSAEQVAACLSNNVASSNNGQSAAAVSSSSDATNDVTATSGTTSPSNPATATVGDEETQKISGWTEVGHQTLAYRLELETLGDSNYYYYDQLGLAGSRSADVSDYTPVGAWESDTSAAVYGALSKVTDKIQGCLSGSSAASHDDVQAPDPSM